jgi:hypothetical protein
MGGLIFGGLIVGGLRYVKNDRSSKFIGEVIFEKYVV